MVCLWIAGGGLSEARDQLKQQAERRHSSGDAVSAVALYRQILHEDPQDPDALHSLGVIAMQAGNPALALSMIEAALAAKPDFLVAWFNRALILYGTQRLDEAEQSARLAVEGKSDLAEGWDLLGLIAGARGDTVQAEACHRRAIDLQPDNPHFHGNLATLLFGLGDFYGACNAARRAESLSPNWPALGLGNILKAMGHPDLAIARFAQTYALRPELSEAAASEAMARLQCGDFEQGWRLWEQRPDLSPELSALPLWQGREVDTLLIYEDQGLGDAIQFVRYLPWLRTKVRKIFGRISPLLRILFADNFPDIVWLDTQEIPHVTARCRLSSLPFFAMSQQASFSSQPYLVADKKKRERGREYLRSLPTPRIGLVWAGNPAFHGDKQRSLPIAVAHSFVQRLGTEHVVSLQKQSEDFLGLRHTGALLQDFADTAGLIAELDLIISVDTAVAHLAGALGRPVFVLLPFDNDWRWLIGREDSPWYPSARLFRQTIPGNWLNVIEQVSQLVHTFIAGNPDVLKPAPYDGPYLTKNPHALPMDRS